MNADDLRAALDYLGLSVAGLVEVTGESPALCRDWATGAVASPRWLDCLIHAWCEHPELLTIALDDAAWRFAEQTLIETARPIVAAKAHAADLH